ncbi:hypothetical protein Tco_0584976 [Tanacetum coccineum]
MLCLEALQTQFKEFFASKGVNSSDHLNQCWQQDFEEYTLCEPETYRRDLLRNLDRLEWAIFRAVIAYGVLRMKEDEFHAAVKMFRCKEGKVEMESSGTMSDERIKAVVQAAVKRCSDARGKVDIWKAVGLCQTSRIQAVGQGMMQILRMQSSDP